MIPAYYTRNSDHKPTLIPHVKDNTTHIFMRLTKISTPAVNVGKNNMDVQRVNQMETWWLETVLAQNIMSCRILAV